MYKINNKGSQDRSLWNTHTHIFVRQIFHFETSLLVICILMSYRVHYSLLLHLPFSYRLLSLFTVFLFPLFLSILRRNLILSSRSNLLFVLTSVDLTIIPLLLESYFLHILPLKSIPYVLWFSYPNHTNLLNSISSHILLAHSH